MCPLSNKEFSCPQNDFAVYLTQIPKTAYLVPVYLVLSCCLCSAHARPASVVPGHVVGLPRALEVAGVHARWRVHGLVPAPTLAVSLLWRQRRDFTGVKYEAKTNLS